MLKPESYKYLGIRPYEGKFAVKSYDFFSQVKRFQDNYMDHGWVYKPLRFEFEITSKCNVSCPHCGMSSKIDGGIDIDVMFITSIIQQLMKNGIPSISITGGEPFMNLKLLSSVISACKTNEIDICKISTNGFWGGGAEEVFTTLKQSGFFCNTYFVPLIMISIGENLIPMETIAEIIYYTQNNFSPNELHICISSMKEVNKLSSIGELIDVYEHTFGLFPRDKIYLTERFYINGPYASQECETENVDINYYIDNCYKCFWQMVGAYVLPTLFMKLDGNCFSCASFNVPNEMHFGSLHEISLHEILHNANNNNYVQIIAREGLEGFRNIIGRDRCSMLQANDFCDACNKLINSIKQLGQYK